MAHLYRLRPLEPNATAVRALLRVASTAQRLPLIRKSAVSIVAMGVRTLLQLLAAILLARLLGPDDLGRYSFAMAVSLLALVPAQFGIHTLLLREGPAITARAAPGQLHVLWRWAFRTAIVTVALSTAVAALAGYAGGAWMPALDRRIYMLALLLIPLAGFANLGEAALQGAGHTLRAMWSGYYVRPGILLLLLGVAALTTGVQARGAMLLQVVAHLAALAMIIWQIATIRHGMPRASPPVAPQAHAWRSAAAAFLFGQSMWVVLAQTDLLVLGTLSTPTQVGLYRAASTAAGFVFIGVIALNSVMSERFAFHHATGDVAGLKRQAALGAALAFIIGAPLATIFIVAGADLMGFVFGPEYAEAGSVIAILAVGQLVQVVTGFAPCLLSMTHAERLSARVLVVAAVMNVALNLLLIPWGARGVAIGTSIAISFQAVLLWWFAWRRSGIDTSVVSALRLSGGRMTGATR